MRLGSVVVITIGIIASFGLLLRQISRPVTSASNPESRIALDSLPETFLWAWERPEKLDFIDINRVGVAYLAKTIQLRERHLFVRPRLQPLILRPGTRVIAVVRIETERHEIGGVSESQIEDAAKEIAEVAQHLALSAVQIDFDARASERLAYRKLLFRVRQLLPSTTPLSMTALASWCAGDNWLSDLPVDEVVPMLFRLGVNRDQFASRLRSGEELFMKPCQDSVGVSTDEKVYPPKRKRLYIFSPDRWTPSTVDVALETYQR
ncbi:MAG TPA: DUF3142 domain-containing protein [Pyrinomonadaceae bacterium]|nr:DUF3142 domain-containing protein [Pyrinomonadaceae bacterium]